MPGTPKTSSRELTITSSTGDYGVLIGVDGAFEEAVDRAAVVIVDAAVAHTLPPGADAVIVDATEATKTLAGCEKIILQLRERGVRRGQELLAVGGGVVQDVVTFVADVYMRGVPWVYVPTTLMAMADSCIGGKSSINVGDVKNLVGGFHPPRSVVVDERFLASLSPGAVAAGLAEAVKIAYCRGAEAFDGYLSRFEAYDRDPLNLVGHVLEAKQWFVQVDEHDRAERLQLNFGHTFGHAFEVACAHRTSHGAAVAVGVLCAGAHPSAVPGEQLGALLDHCRLLLDRTDLQPALAAFDATVFERAFRSDKKHTKDAFTLVLPTAPTGVRLVATDNGDQGWQDVYRAVTATLRSLERT